MAIADGNGNGTGASRLENLLRELDRILKQPYAFDVFKAELGRLRRPDHLPADLGVAELSGRRPGHHHAPGPEGGPALHHPPGRQTEPAEEGGRRQPPTQRTETADTGRAESEIVEKASKKTNFQLTANESFGSDETMKVTGRQLVAGSQEKESQNTKRTFNENVRKSAQEYRQQHRTEIDTTSSTEFEETSFREIQNPNNELAVTYLFYELQRTYRLRERLQGLTPVALVANESGPGCDRRRVAGAHDWILRRAILDDSFRPALDYLTKSFVGAEVNIAILESNAEAQKKVVEALGEQVRAQMASSARTREMCSPPCRIWVLPRATGSDRHREGDLRPARHRRHSDTGAVDAAQLMVDYAKETATGPSANGPGCSTSSRSP